MPFAIYWLSMFRCLASKQQRLGAEFERVWSEHALELYEE